MTAFEIYLGRHMKSSEGAKEIEFYISKILNKQEIERRERLVKKKKYEQLSLFEKAPM